ncbi:MAG: ester cyclase [Thermomicrobia bacterium]|nr:ester cyclase [Thermomicrobia bacterium]
MELVFSRHDLAAAIELMAADHVTHFASQEVRGVDAFTPFVAHFLAAFPDMHLTVEDAIAEGNKVVCRITWTGTYQGELMGIAPTGKRVTSYGMSFFRIADGKVAEEWVGEDMLALMEQIGAVPSPG